MNENKKNVVRLLNTAKGQIDGIVKMINDDKYCIEVSNQILSSIAILKRANIELLDNHLNNCVVNATTKEEKEEKMQEISDLLKKVIK